ncbi:MAG: DUF4139 domain-containing protein [Lachnospiraceae bacterium]|nr:DUF4139 domain-containing protein [Lachnospiraceae bacterium]
MIAKSTVKEVQVYRNSASVIRTGEVELKAGRNIIYVGGMTLTSKQEDFVLSFPENVKATNIQIIKIDDIDDFGERESEKIQKKIDEIDYQIETSKLLIDLRKTNGDFSKRTDVSVEAQEQYMVALPARLLELHKQIGDLEEEREKLVEDQEDAVKEENKPLIMAEIFYETDGKIPFTLRYQETTGKWKPKYEVRYKSNEEPLEVSMKAQITQNSDEDWKQVKVTLYSGNPAVFHGLPELDPVHVSIFVDQPVYRGRAKGNARMCESSMIMDEDVCPEDICEEEAPVLNMAPVKMQEAEVQEEETMSAFILPDLKDILNGTDGNIVVLQSFKVPANYQLLSIPRVDTKSFLTAEINESDWPLPAAYASVYIKDLFAGDIYVDPDTDIDKFSLSLGQDERITVVREELPRKTQEALLKNQRKQVRTSRIKLINNSKETVKVLLKDQIPVSTDKAVTVDVIKLSEGVLNEEKGEVSWELMAEPKNAIELELSYSLAWPKDKRLSERTVR